MTLSKLTVSWPMLLPSMANERLHWSAKARKVKAQRATCALSLRANGVGWRLTPLETGDHLVVVLVRQAPRRLDSDNLQGAFKAIRDEVAAFFHVPDNHPSITWCYKQVKGPATVSIELEVLAKEAMKAISDRIDDNAREVIAMAERAGLLP